MCPPAGRVRKASKEDLEKIYEIERRSFPYPYSPWDFSYFLNREPQNFLVWETEGEIVGYIVGNCQKDKLTIISIAVLPEFRRRGIGTALIKELIRKNTGSVRKVELQVRISNLPAISLYQKLGFTLIRRLPFYYRDGEDAYLFQKYIPKIKKENSPSTL